MRTTIYFAFLLLFFIGCSDEKEQEITPVRTVLFYMGGDNTLTNEVQEKTDELKDVPVSDGGHLLVYIDSKGSNPKLIKAGNGKLTILREYEDSNSADADVFKGVLQEVVEQYPAPSYGLVLFSHASGWMPEGTWNNPSLRSVIIDGSHEMEIPDLASVIPDGMFDHIIFEACFMAGVEVAYELKEKTKYIVASSAEIVSPGFSSIYAEVIPLLFKREADLTGFCRKVEASYKTRSDNYNSLTLSLINTEGLNDIVGVLRSSDVAPDSGSQCFGRHGNLTFFDLYDGYKSLPAAKQAELKTAINKCVIWKYASAQFMPNYGGFDIQAHSGLTMYIPQEHYPNLNKTYKQLSWYKAIRGQE